MRRKWLSLLLLNVLLAVFLAALALIHPIDPIRDYTIPRQGGGEELPIYGERSARQAFVCEKDADTLEIRVGTVREDYYGPFVVTLEDEEGNVVLSEKTDKLDLTVGARSKDGWIGFRVPEGLRAGTGYILSVSAPELSDRGAVTLAYLPEATAEGRACAVNGLEADGEFAFAVCTERTNWFFILAVAILFATANYWWLNRKKDVRKTAVWILLGTGLVMTLIMCPGSQPDEEYHYCSAYKLSNVMMGVKENVNAVEPGMYAGFRQHYNRNDSFLKLMNELFGGEVEITEEKDQLERSDELSAPIAYAAPALGITAVRLLGGNEAQAYTAARLMTMLSYVALCVIAIRLMPGKRELTLLICIIPMAAHMAASTSRDAFVNGMTLVFMAYMFRIYAGKEPFTLRRALAVTGLLALFGPAKIFHCLLALTALLIPKKQFRGRWDRAGKIALILAGTALVLLLSQGGEISKALTASDYAGRRDYYHLSFAIDRPVKYLRLLWGSIEGDFWFYVKDSMGGRLAGLTVPVAEYLCVGFLGVLFAAAFRQDEGEEFLSRGQKAFMLVFCVLGYAVMAAGFSFKDTIYGTPRISGIQGRYLLSFALPFFCAIGSRKVSMKFAGYKLFYPVWFIYAGFIVYVMSQIAV